VSAERPTPDLRRLGEDQNRPSDFLVAFTERLLDRRAQLVHQGLAAATARQRAVAETVQGFTAGTTERGWTVAEQRIAQLADDTLGLEDEYRDQHGYEPNLARLVATGEVLQGERAREDLPAWLLPQPDPPGWPDPDRGQRLPSERTVLDNRTHPVPTRERGRER
jgi:hypothetical protein